MKLSLNSFQNTHDWLKTQNDPKHWQGIWSGKIGLGWNWSNDTLFPSQDFED